MQKGTSFSTHDPSPPFLLIKVCNLSLSSYIFEKLARYDTDLLLKIIQIITILQGAFLVFVMFQRRQSYQRTIFWLFIGCLISILLFAIGDDEYNLLLGNTSWFLFHEPLVITFFFLFVRHSHSAESRFKTTDLLFFIPYGLFVTFEIITKTKYFNDNPVLETIDLLIEFSFFGMLLYCIYDILRNRKEKWLLAFIIPFSIVFFTDEVHKLTISSKESFFYLDSYGIFLIAILLFYFVSYQLMIAPKSLLAQANTRYQSSSLAQAEVDATIASLHRLMQEQQIFRNQKLTVNEVATELQISRQQLSEILNSHMGIRFQDLLNQYRVEAFITCLAEEQYQHYTLLGIANEVGFSSKSTFNAIFKKLKGMTPSQYKKSQNIR